MRMTALDAHAISSVRFHVRFSDAAGVDLMTEIGREADASSALHLHFPTGHLGKLPLGHRSALIKVVCQILQMDTHGTFLTCFYSHERQGDVA